jgi:hypothetical protein
VLQIIASGPPQCAINADQPAMNWVDHNSNNVPRRIASQKQFWNNRAFIRAIFADDAKLEEACEPTARGAA